MNSDVLLLILRACDLVGWISWNWLMWYMIYHMISGILFQAMILQNTFAIGLTQGYIMSYYKKANQYINMLPYIDILYGCPDFFDIITYNMYGFHPGVDHMKYMSVCMQETGC